MLPKALIHLLRHLIVASANQCVSDIVKGRSDDKPIVAFVGYQKQGKSTLINALIGHDVLPVNSLPATATTCTVAYGPVPEASIMWGGQWQCVPYEDRALYIDQNLLGDRAAADGAHFTYPSAILATMTILDTAGLGSSFAPHAERSRQAFSNADLFVLVCSLQRPLGKDDLEILNVARARQVPVIAVITKCDEADGDDPESDIERVTTFVESVASGAGITLARVFALSVRHNDHPESAVRGAVESLRAYLLTASRSARVQASFGRCRATLESTLAALVSHRESLSSEQAQTAALLTKSRNEMERIEREREAKTSATRADHNQFMSRFEAGIEQHLEQALASIVPIESAVNKPANIPGQWTRLRDAASVTFPRIRERLQQELSAEIDAANADLSFEAGEFQRLLTSVTNLPELRCDLPQKAPSSVLREPGFLSVTLGLHGEYVRNQMGERLFESFQRTEMEFRVTCDALLDALRDARVGAVELRMGRQVDAARAVAQGHYETICEGEARLEENKNEQQAVRDRHAASISAAANHQAILARLQDGDSYLVESELRALKVGDVELPALSGIRRYLSGAYAEAAVEFARSPMVNPTFDEAVARMYWISRCRQTTSVTEKVSRACGMSERDPLGAAFFATVESGSTYTPLQELVVAAMCNRRVSIDVVEATLDTALTALFAAACIAVDADRASKVSANMLQELGAPSASLLLREQLAFRVNQRGERVGLAVFAALHAKCLGTEEVRSDLEERLCAHAKGVEPDPCSLRSVRDFVHRERWQAIAL